MENGLSTSTKGWGKAKEKDHNEALKRGSTSTIEHNFSLSLSSHTSVCYQSTCLEYGMGSKAFMTWDVNNFGILLLEMFTRSQPTDAMFSEGLTLYEFSKMALREKVMKIVVPSLLWEVTSNKSRSNTRGDWRARMEDCLNSVIRITILCSMESPNKLIDVKAIIYKVVILW